MSFILLIPNFHAVRTQVLYFRCARSRRFLHPSSNAFVGRVPLPMENASVAAGRRTGACRSRNEAYSASKCSCLFLAREVSFLSLKRWHGTTPELPPIPSSLFAIAREEATRSISRVSARVPPSLLATCMRSTWPSFVWSVHPWLIVPLVPAARHVTSFSVGMYL